MTSPARLVRGMAFVLLLAWPAACRRAESVDRSKLLPVPLPDLSGMERTAQVQVQERHSSLTGMIAGPGRSPADMGAASRRYRHRSHGCRAQRLGRGLFSQCDRSGARRPTVAGPPGASVPTQRRPRPVHRLFRARRLHAARERRCALVARIGSARTWPCKQRGAALFESVFVALRLLANVVTVWVARRLRERTTRWRPSISSACWP